MAVSESDIKLYLTSLLPNIEQTIYSQSIGGYPGTVNTDATTGLVYPETTISSDMPTRGVTMNLTDYTKIANVRFVNIDSEILDATNVNANALSGIDKAYNEIRAMHVSGDVARGFPTSSGFFDDYVNDSFKQYRCIAIKNTHATDAASNLGVYIAQNSRNTASKIRIAVEQPRADYRADTVDTTLTTKNQFRIADLVGSFEDNHFANCYVRFLTGNVSGQEATILSYDASTGTFTLESSLTQIVDSGSTLEIEPSPAQRVVSGVNRPSDNGRLTGFTEALKHSAANINVTGSRDHGFDLDPNDVVYVWVERSLDKNSNSFSNNNFILGINFTAT